MPASPPSPSSSPADDLDAAIAQLYRTFSRYRADDLGGCPHCVAEADALTANDLEHYAFKAMTTWGSVDEFKHFLPRLFEILARDGEADFTLAEIVLSKPGYGKWQKWTRNERVAVDDFFRALWLDLLSRHPHPLSADSCLCGIAGSVPDMTFYLDAWSRSDGRAAMMHLAEFVGYNAAATRRNTPQRVMRNPFWGDRQPQAEQVSHWPLDPARVAQLERAFFACGRHAGGDALSTAVDTLTAMQRAVAVR